MKQSVFVCVLSLFSFTSIAGAFDLMINREDVTGYRYTPFYGICSCSGNVGVAQEGNTFKILRYNYNCSSREGWPSSVDSLGDTVYTIEGSNIVLGGVVLGTITDELVHFDPILHGPSPVAGAFYEEAWLFGKGFLFGNPKLSKIEWLHTTVEGRKRVQHTILIAK